MLRLSLLTNYSIIFPLLKLFKLKNIYSKLSLVQLGISLLIIKLLLFYKSWSLTKEDKYNSEI